MIAIAACTRPPTLAPEAEQALRDDLSLHLFDIGAPARTIDLTLPVAVDTRSILISIALDDPIVGLTLSRLIAPDEAFWHDEDDVRFESRIAGTSYSSIGELALYLPLSPGRALQPGEWQLRFELDEPVPVRRAAVLSRTTSPNASSTFVIDMALGIATDDPRLRDQASADDAAMTWRRTIDRTLAPHGLALGHLTLVHDERLGDYATLDPDEDQASDGCRTLYALVDEPMTFKALLIDRFESVDPESVDGTLGLSPQPGTLFDPASSESCAFIALEPFLAEPIDNDELDRQLGATLLHEAGHFMGLDHTSEADGQVHDRLADTADCRIDEVDGRENLDFEVAGERDGVIDDFECGRSGGANNLMFWSGVSDFAPFVLSDSQAWVLRRHPLFAPMGEP